MKDRSAVDTIRGYFYQFDLTILSLLQLRDKTASIDVENIEDIDITQCEETTAIQCKYYDKTEYNHSLISKPIRYMLADFKQRLGSNRSRIKYHIYGKFHSGQDKLALPFDAVFLKKHFLTYKLKGQQHYYHAEEGISDEDLAEFISFLTIDITGKTIKDQYVGILSALKNIFRCCEFEAEHYYYNNALHCIRDLATNSDAGCRRISKETFLNRINEKRILFNRWFIELKGRKAFLDSIRKQYFLCGLNTSPFERFFLIDCALPGYDRASLKSILMIIQKKWSKLSPREPQSFCPYVLLHNLNEPELIQLKSELHAEGCFCIDGVDFQGALFSPNSLCRQATYGNGIKLKIINHLQCIEPLVAEIRKTKEIYQFFFTAPFFEPHTKSIKHVKVQLESLLDIEEVVR